MESIDLRLDVSEAAGLGEEATIAATVHLPDAAADDAVVCFGKPGGGYARGYFTVDLPGPVRGSQAEWHAQRGWVFVSVDHLGVGDSSTHHDGRRLDYTTLAAAAQSAEEQILARLADGSLGSGGRRVTAPVKLGIGQSMGGCMTIVQQGQHHCYDGIGVLGYSAVYTHPPVRPGEPPIVPQWLSRETLIGDRMRVLNLGALDDAQRTTSRGTEVLDQGPNMAWGFHYDDIDPEVVRADVIDFPTRNGDIKPWMSATLPLAVAMGCLTPGVVAAEAAAVRVPVLAAFGERDVCEDTKGEVRAYHSTNSFDLYVCPRMAHMHNFAGTRELFWRRIEIWADWVRAVSAH